MNAPRENVGVRRSHSAPFLPQAAAANQPATLAAGMVLTPNKQPVHVSRFRTFHRTKCQHSMKITESHADYEHPKTYSLWLCPTNGKPASPWVNRQIDAPTSMRIHSTGDILAFDRPIS